MKKPKIGVLLLASGWMRVASSATTRPALRSITDTDPSLAIKRTGSTRTSVPLPAGPVTLFVSGRLPPQLLT